MALSAVVSCTAIVHACHCERLRHEPFPVQVWGQTDPGNYRNDPDGFGWHESQSRTRCWRVGYVWQSLGSHEYAQTPASSSTEAHEIDEFSHVAGARGL